MSTFSLSRSTQLIESAVCILAFFVLKYLGRFVVRNAVVRSSFKAREEKEVSRLLNLLTAMVMGVILAAIWSVEQNAILVFAASVVTVLGVAFFAEMSILTNVTACMVLFFQHPMKIGDRIKLHGTEQELEGELMDITYFFLFIRTSDNSIISVPNSVLLTNPFSILGSKKPPAGTSNG